MQTGTVQPYAQVQSGQSGLRVGSPGRGGYQSGRRAWFFDQTKGFSAFCCHIKLDQAFASDKPFKKIDKEWSNSVRTRKTKHFVKGSPNKLHTFILPGWANHKPHS